MAKKVISLDELKKQIASKLRDARIKRGVTQMQIANSYGIERSGITRFESGKVNLSIETIHKYLVALNAEIILEIKLK